MTRLLHAIPLFLLLTACARPSAASPPTATPPPTPTPTPALGFSVAVTPGTRSTPTPSPQPAATPFVAPRTSWLRLIPNHGYPVAGTLHALGGNLPPSAPVDLIWMLGTRTSPIIRTTATDAQGRLSTSFPIPASPPGTYRVRAEVNGAPIVTAAYTVVAGGTLSVRVASAPGGHHVYIVGRGFQKVRSLLIAIDRPNSRRHAVGAFPVTAAPDGTFSYTLTTRKLTPGQYFLTAISARFLVPVAQTIFQVVV